MSEEFSNVDDMDEANVRPKKMKKSGRVVIQRSEASQNISEFNLNEVGKERVKLDELIKSSQKLAGNERVKKQLINAKNLKSLVEPLSKPQIQKIKRGIAYEKVCDEVTKWDPVVRGNRVADQIIYPLKKPEIRLETFSKVAENFKFQHPVEIAVNELLKKSQNVITDSKPFTEAEEKAIQAMCPEEAKLRHDELMKHRALVSYKVARAYRQNKIKSKRFHRVLKKEKMKKMMKEFEVLKDSDREAALEKLMEADKVRVLERMTLKHRNSGKWAKQQKLRAKYNPDSRSALKEDILIGKKLREKLDVEKINVPENVEEDVAFFSGRGTVGLIEDVDHDVINNEKFIPFTDVEASQVHQTTATDIENGNSFSPANDNSEVHLKTKTQTQKSVPHKKKKVVNVSETIEFVDMQILDSLVPDIINVGDEDLDDVPKETVNISEAFADEDLIAEFREEKKSADKSNKLQGIDLHLPGWNAWAGPNIKISKRKKKRFFIKAPVEAPRKNTLGNVIWNEDGNKKAAAHQVNHLPFPFTNVHQFESYIRQPIGHTWNPQSSFHNLIAPKVVTKLGKIIEPIDPEDVVLKKKTTNSAPNLSKGQNKTRQAF